MSKGIESRTGRYLHAADAKAVKSFGGRQFAVLIAGAYDAGIIGPEHNGIAVIDLDRRSVILDRHAPEASGYAGPSDAQRAEMERVMAMDWPAFAKFMTGHRNYREGTVPDADLPQPEPMKGIESRVILEPLPGDAPFPAPLLDRKEIIAFLVSHPVHHLDGPYSNHALAWDVKVQSFDSSGRVEGFDPDPEFDARWERHCQENPDLFWLEAEDALRPWISKDEGGFTLYGEDEPFDGDFRRTGRSGGWVVLAGFEGYPLSWPSVNGMEESLDSMDDASLGRLYRAVCQVDAALAGPAAAMAWQYAARREMTEEEWKQEASSVPSM